MEEYIVSARKYRPMTFDSVVGQSALTTTLKNAVKSGKLAHAYLFCGPRGVGKTTCARIFAKAINCEHPREDGEACNECESCQAFNEQRSYNIFELDAASNNGVEQIKALMEQTRIPPQVGKYKVFIIDEVHMLSAAAFNAFLKTLEEPPSHVIFILATTEKHKILPTILSRCQIYDFERMTEPNTIKHLAMVAEKEGIKYEEQALAVIAEKADGGMRDALSIFDQAASFCQGDITYKKVIEDLNVLDCDNYFSFVELALSNKVSEMMVLLNNILNKGFDGGLLVQGLAQHVRNVMMAKDPQTLPLLETSDDQRAKYQAQAQAAPTPFLYKALKIMNDCDVQYRQSSNKRLLVELTLIQVGQITQPEDKDVPSAGRTPHRLKSLFQKLIAPLKPASQGAGAGQEDSKKVEAAPVVKETSAPTSAPKTSFKVGSIGMTFKNLKRSQEAAHKKYNVISDIPEANAKIEGDQQPFNDEQLYAQWMTMLMRMQNLDAFYALSQRLKLTCPKIVDYPTVEVVIDNPILLDEVMKIKNRIRLTLVQGLHNDTIVINYRLAKQEEIGKIRSKREILEDLEKSNEGIAQLIRDFHLVMA